MFTLIPLGQAYLTLSTVNEPSFMPRASWEPSLLKHTLRTASSMLQRAMRVWSARLQSLHQEHGKVRNATYHQGHHQYSYIYLCAYNMYCRWEQELACSADIMGRDGDDTACGKSECCDGIDWFLSTSRKEDTDRTDRSSLPVTAIGCLGWRSNAQSSPSEWPCMIRRGLSLSRTITSKISLSCVPARILSAFQQTLRIDRPTVGKKKSVQCPDLQSFKEQRSVKRP